MGFQIRMGLPEMKELWDRLQQNHLDGAKNKDDELLYKKLGSTLVKLALDPRYNGLQSHEIDALTKRYGIKVFQSDIENNTSSAMRLYWVYGPDRMEITIIGLEPHPEDDKNGAYDRINLSSIK